MCQRKGGAGEFSLAIRANASHMAAEAHGPVFPAFQFGPLLRFTFPRRRPVCGWRRIPPVLSPAGHGAAGLRTGPPAQPHEIENNTGGRGMRRPADAALSAAGKNEIERHE
jgi:hypothetical protein